MNILDLIGNTPLQNIGNIYFKMEQFNPSGSIKDRTAKEMILKYCEFISQPHFSHVGLPVKKGTVFVESSTGNTGTSVAMVASALGCKSVIYISPDTSAMKVKLMKSYGATVIQCSSMKRAMQKAKDYDNMYADSFYLDQFSNPNNVKGLERMAREARRQLWKMYGYLDNTHATIPNFDIFPDAVVAGVGTGGTIMGLRNTFPDADVYMVKPLGSDKIDGIADGVELPLIPKDLKASILYVSGTKARRTARYLRQTYGIDCGVSGGANYYACTLISKGYKKILTVMPDAGYRYL